MKPTTNVFNNFINHTCIGTQQLPHWLRPLAIAALMLTAAFFARAAGLPNQIEMALHGQPNATYLVEASTNLQQWTVIATNRANPTGVLGFHDPQAGQFPRRYYRGVQVTNAILLSQGLSGESYDPGKILVKPLTGASLSGLNRSLGVTVLNVFPAIGNLEIVKVPGNLTASTLITLFQQSGLVQYAERDFYVQALTEPNDPHYVNGDLWNMNNLGQYGGTAGADIHATNAWSTITDASGIIVAVVDTGVRYTHEDLAANMWVNPADGSHGTNVVAGTTDPNDDNGHGTHVSGTIGADGNNGLGVVGVCWHVQIMACKFLDASGSGTIDGAISCIDYARSHGAKIINASWGTTNFTSQALHDAIASTRDAGIIFVAAAGNSSADNDTTPLYPASYRDLDNVVAVAATDRNDLLASFSDYGSNSVDLAAPGTPIMSCWNGSDSDYQDDDGTSMSCAHVSGACALVWADHPTETYRQIINRILAGADPLASLQGKTITGGRLDVAKALGATNNAPPPTLTASFSASPSSGSAPLTVQFTDTSTGNPVSWNWNFGDGSTSTTQNPSHTYNSAGSFTTTLTVANTSGQTNSASQTITATTSSTLPVITLTATQPNAYASGQVPGTITFHRTGDTSQSYEVYWAFSGTATNGVDYEQLPTNSPFPAGQADATLTITPIDHGPEGDKTVIVTLAPGPAYQIGASNNATVIIHGYQSGTTASFTANPTSGQAPMTVQFTDTSSGNPFSWNWNFGDGATSTAQNPSHTYNSAGSFTATLTVTSSSNQTSSASQTITVTNAPSPVTASFSANPTSGQAPLTVQFADQSTGPVTAWNWSFGDGSSSTMQSPSHTYSSAGSFTAALTVTGSSGQTSSASHTITVTNAPSPVSASFSANPSSGQAPLAVQFTDQSTGPVTAWNWNFGDGSANSTTQNPSHTYVSVGSFTATLTVTGSSGQSSSASHIITVTNATTPVTASFSANPSSGQAPLVIQFTDQSTGPVTAWNWNFGDGSTSTTQSPSHTYSNVGSFTATLTVTGSSGQTSSTSHTITVTNAPSPVSASFTANPSSGQAPLAVQFTDQSTGPVTAWNWSFGDGSANNTTQNPSHTYNNAGSFTATLTVTGSSGQTSSTSRTIIVTNAPPPPTSTVTVVASQPLATSLTPGVFTLTRNGSTGSQLTVNYSLGGTAVNGVDYQKLSGSVVFPARSSTTTVVVQPEGLLTVLRTVVLTLSPGSNYQVGSPGSATVTIVASVGLK